MSEVRPQTVARVYIKDPNVNRTSMWHTMYIGEEGHPDKLHRVEIFGGVYKHMPLAVFERFKAAGLVTTDRPRRPNQGDDD